MKNQYTHDYIEDTLTRFAYHSTGIEGNTLNLTDTMLILQHGMLPTESGHSLREVYEVDNHRPAFDYLFEATQNNKKFSPFLVRNFHYLLTDHILQDHGQYKTMPNYINGAVFNTAEPFEVPMKIQEWCDQLNKDYQSANTLEDELTVLLQKHIEFERIHPFSDGNGRTGRMLINYGLVLKNQPLLIIERDARDQYVKYEANEDVKGLFQYATEKLISERERMRNFYLTVKQNEEYQAKQLKLLKEKHMVTWDPKTKRWILKD